MQHACAPLPPHPSCGVDDLAVYLQIWLFLGPPPTSEKEKKKRRWHRQIQFFLPSLSLSFSRGESRLKVDFAPLLLPVAREDREWKKEEEAKEEGVRERPSVQSVRLHCLPPSLLHLSPPPLVARRKRRARCFVLLLWTAAAAAQVRRPQKKEEEEKLNGPSQDRGERGWRQQVEMLPA